MVFPLCSSLTSEEKISLFQELNSYHLSQLCIERKGWFSVPGTQSFVFILLCGSEWRSGHLGQVGCKSVAAGFFGVSTFVILVLAKMR